MDLNVLLSLPRGKAHISLHRRFLALSKYTAPSMLAALVALGCGAAHQGPSTETNKPPERPAAASPTPVKQAANTQTPAQAPSADESTQQAQEPVHAPEPEAPKAPEVRSRLAITPDDGKPRLYAPAGLVTIHDKPDRMAPVIGAFRAGQSVVMKDTTLTPERTLNKKYQCEEGWYPVEPRGFVCVGGADHAVKNADDPRVIAARAVLPDVDADYPYKVGTSVGAPQYLRIPTEAEQKQIEGDVAAYKASLPADDAKKGGAIDAKPVGHGPSKALLHYLQTAKPQLVHENELYEGYKISWTQEFDANGRTWILTPDMTIVPKDKIRTKPTPTLKGIRLKDHPDMKLPLAFFWLDDSKKFEKGEDGKLHETDEVVKRHSFVETTMEQAMGPGGVYWKLRDGSYIKYSDMTIIRKQPRRYAGIGPNDKWVEVRVTWGYLAAYEGDELEYVTAISPGVDGINAAKHATARGKHFVDWKLYSGDMSGKDKGKPWYVDEVPWVQYYKGNYALHGAWWHNNFGRPMSHGCINLSPPDARELFNWMDPQVPDGWYAVASYYPHARGTMVYIRP
jgi:lipoprotein-anchoring transpeptidase ErfK/SrfK